MLAVGLTLNPVTRQQGKYAVGHTFNIYGYPTGFLLWYQRKKKKICKTSSAEINVKRLRRGKNIQVPSHHFSGDPKGNRRGFSLHDSQSKASVYTSLWAVNTVVYSLLTVLFLTCYNSLFTM